MSKSSKKSDTIATNSELFSLSSVQATPIKVSFTADNYVLILFRNYMRRKN